MMYYAQLIYSLKYMAQQGTVKVTLFYSSLSMSRPKTRQDQKPHQKSDTTSISKE